MRKLPWLIVFGLVLAPQLAHGQHGKWWPFRPSCPQPACSPYAAVPQPYCPPGMMPPTVPTTPPTTPPTTEPPVTEPPTEPVPPTPETPSPTDFFAQAPPAGTASPGTFAPNVFGDQLGTSITQIFLTVKEQTVTLVPRQIVDDVSAPPNGVVEFEEQIQIVDRVIVIDLPNPSGGGKVGRLQFMEDFSPLPRDRFIFNYDFFNNVPLTAGGWDVHRYVFGVEKTFFNGNTSVEVRVPFASTLNNDILVGAENSNIELGNMRLLLKGLLFGNNFVNIAGGLAIHLPTAPDARASIVGPNLMGVGPDGSLVGPLQGPITAAEIRNETVILTPYFGALFTPTRRAFFQTWMAFDFDTRGNPVFVNPTLQNLQFAGRLTEQTLLQASGQVGYWIVQHNNPEGGLSGLAPFVELHYCSTLGRPDVIRGQGFVIADPRGNRDELNLTTGVLALFGSRCSLAVGCSMPLRGQDDRSFDFQFGVRANFFFGATARQREMAYFVP